MKILILGFAKIKFMPYMNFYLENINCKENDVHLLYWNRDLQGEDTEKYSDITLHEFRFYQEDDVPKLFKIKSFLSYRKYAKRLIKENKFDSVFVLHSLPGVLLADILKKEYNNKLIFDYRDVTYEGFPPYKKIVGDLVRSSKATFVSSDAYRSFLPEEEKEKIFTSHNILTDSLNHRDDKEKFGTESEKIRISFWGFIRHEDVNLELIKKIGADNRFELHYYGREQQIAENLKAFVKENNIENVYFHGEYKPQDRYEFVKVTDIIHNMYDDNNMHLAMSNKYYDGAIFRIPQICTKGSFMGQMAEKHGIGKTFDYKSGSLCQDIYEYYSAIDRREFIENCNRETDRVSEEYINAGKIIKGNVIK